MKYSSFLIPIIVAGVWLSCERSDVEPYYLLEQIAGCAGGLAKSTTADSSFTYQFETDLIIEFNVTANCCPDSNRFVLSSEIIDDDITIVVQDTAAGLCRCICPYVVHAEFYELPLDQYLVQVKTDTDYVAYEESVRRGE